MLTLALDLLQLVLLLAVLNVVGAVLVWVVVKLMEYVGII
jgi:hypothetical protein